MTRKTEDTHDLDAIFADVRAAVLSLRAVAAKHDLPESTLRGLIRKHNVKRDLGEAVREKTQETLVRGDARDPNAREDVIINDAANVRAGVVQTHRKDIAQGRQTVKALMTELANLCTMDITMKDIQAAADGDDGKLGALLGALSIKSRSEVVRNLSAALKNLIPLEREAFSIDDKKPVDPGAGNNSRAIGKAEAEALDQALDKFGSNDGQQVH